MGGEIVFVDELTRIKECEEKADQVRQVAKVDAKKKIEVAHTTATKVANDAENLAKEDFDSLIRDGEEKAEKQYTEYVEKTEKECAAMIAKAKENTGKAIDIIVERIVSNSVNN
ncbi:MAG: hypothetical protein RR313_05140 [Anaerovoracaceae bacterium]